MKNSRTLNIGIFSKTGKLLSAIAKGNVEALADIDYWVSDQNNDPKSCTTKIWFEAGAQISPGNYAAQAGFFNVSGIVNTCKEPASGTTPTGCDPYSCHQRV